MLNFAFRSIPMSPPRSGGPLAEALGGGAPSPPPVWLMRQAGRYLPEFRELRKRTGSFLDLCNDPSAAAEATLQPFRRFSGLDGAVVFSDILTVLQALGMKLDFVEGAGPVLDPLSGPEAVAALPGEADRGPLDSVRETIGIVRGELPPEVAVLGFAGAPWTLAAYAIEGGTSRDFARVRAAAYGSPGAFARLVGRLAEVVADHLAGQLEAGADAVQLFDSHAGVLDAAGFLRWSVEPVRVIVGKVRERVPGARIIGFPRGCGAGYEAFAERTGVDAVSVDQHVAPEWAAERLQTKATVQGNLDPVRLVAGGRALREGVRGILSALGEGPLIANLGHGVLPYTPPENVAEFIRLVKEGAG